MKFIKYGIIIVIVAVVTNILVSFASSSSIVYTLTVNYNLDKGNMTRTPWIEKVDYTYPTYEHLLSRTILTNPCTSCKILAKPYDDDGDVYVGVVTVMGETQTFRDPTSISSPNNYSLGIQRLDPTLLDTFHSGIWTVNQR